MGLSVSGSNNESIKQTKELVEEVLKSGSSVVVRKSGELFENPMWFLQTVQEVGAAETSEEKREVVKNRINQKLIETATQVGSDIVSKGKELVVGFINKAADATAKVTESSSRIEAAQVREQQLVAVNDEKVKEILGNVNGYIGKIEELIEELQKLGEEQVIESEEKIEEEKENIQKQADILNDPSKDDEERKAALESLQASSANIQTLVANVIGCNDKIAELSAQVAEHSEAIAQLTQEAVQQVAETMDAIEGVQAEVTKEGAVNVKIAKDGAKDESIGVALEAEAATQMASSVFTFGITGATGAATQEKAAEYLAAAQTELAGSGKNFSELGVALGQMGKDAASVASDIQTIGSFESQAAVLIGRYNTMAAASITAIGSWSALEKTPETLNKAIDEYSDAYQIELEKQNTDNSVEADNNSENKGFVKKDNNGVARNLMGEAVKFNFKSDDMKIQKLSFGI